MMPTPDSQPIGRPGVSVVIPAYNHAQYLPTAIESVLAQTYPSLEVIVVNDGSSDETPAVLERYAGRIRVVNQVNAGLPAARNSGVRAARFPYVAFLDADDVWRPNLVKRLMEIFAGLSPDFGLVASLDDLTLETGELMHIRGYEKRIEREISVRDLILLNRFGASSVVVKKEALEQAGLFDTTLKSSEDRDMWIRIAARNRVYRIADKLALVRRHGGNMSKQGDRMKRGMLKVLGKAHRDRAVSRDCWWFWFMARAFLYFQVSQINNGAGRRGEAFALLGKSLLCWPWFPDPDSLNQPALFRLRSAVRYLLDGLAGRGSTKDAATG